MRTDALVPEREKEVHKTKLGYCCKSITYQAKNLGIYLLISILNHRNSGGVGTVICMVFILSKSGNDKVDELEQEETGRNGGQLGGYCDNANIRR